MLWRGMERVGMYHLSALCVFVRRGWDGIGTLYPYLVRDVKTSVLEVGQQAGGWRDFNVLWHVSCSYHADRHPSFTDSSHS